MWLIYWKMLWIKNWWSINFINTPPTRKQQCTFACKAKTHSKCSLSITKLVQLFAQQNNGERATQELSLKLVQIDLHGFAINWHKNSWNPLNKLSSLNSNFHPFIYSLTFRFYLLADKVHAFSRVNANILPLYSFVRFINK